MNRFRNSPRTKNNNLKFSRLILYILNDENSPTKHQTTTYGLTWAMSPTTITMATHDTMSAWFWMMNSWLNIGGFLFDVFLTGFTILRRSYRTARKSGHERLPDRTFNSTSGFDSALPTGCHETANGTRERTVIRPRLSNRCRSSVRPLGNEHKIQREY